MKLQPKILIPIFAILILSFLAVGIISAYNTRSIETAVLEQMDDTNIALAQTLAFLVAEDPGKLEPDRMAQLANLFNVDEVHITDENGVLRWGNVADFYDFDFSTSEQTIPLLEILQNPALTIAQEPQPRGADGVMFQYISVSRIDQRGIVQVGVSMQTIERIENYGTRALITIFAAGIAAILVSAAFTYMIVLKIIVNPLSMLTTFMFKASSTGDITLRPEDVEVIGRYTQSKDEIGQTIASCAAFVGHVTDVSKNMEIIASGDLTAELELLSDKDTLGLELKKMTENLNNMFADIQASTNQVSKGSTQVSDGAQSLSQGSTEQAASVEELSSTIAEIATRTKANAETADKTSKLSATIKESAEKGSRQMDEMITAVKEINEASQSISKIIKTIDDIAFQTNILALNAAVEAARAGQHGKGFAVVAEEVRNLASKSAEAAKDTGSIIQNSMEKAEFGSRIAGDTASSLSEIVTGINESNQLVSEIADATEQQSLSIEQINNGIDQVAQVVQQNSATAEESAAVAEEMNAQSNILTQLVSQFKLKDSGALSRSLPSPVKPAQSHQAMPENGGTTQNNGNGDFGKY